MFENGLERFNLEHFKYCYLVSQNCFLFSFFVVAFLVGFWLLLGVFFVCVCVCVCVCVEGLVCFLNVYFIVTDLFSFYI